MIRVMLMLGAMGLTACGTEVTGSGAGEEPLSTANSEVRACQSAFTGLSPTRSMASAVAQAKAECAYCRVLTLDLFKFDCRLSTRSESEVVAAAQRVVAAVPEGDAQWSTGTARGMNEAAVVNEFGQGSALSTFFLREVRGTISGVSITGSAEPDSRNDLIAVWGSGEKRVYVVTRGQAFP